MCKNTVVSIGFNHIKMAKGGATNHSSTLDNRYQLHTEESVHAESDAITKFHETIKRKKRSSRGRLVLYSFRVTNDGTLRNAQPCASCCNKIKAEKRIRNVISSTNTGFEEKKSSQL